MSIEHVLAFTTFAMVATITPGPNNLMLMSSGSVFGFRQTLPHIAGVVSGLAVLLSAMILGLGLLIEQWPVVMRAVQFAGGAWLAWLGARLLWAAIGQQIASHNTESAAAGRPLRALEAALFQWANPKAIAMTASCAAAFTALSPSIAIRFLTMVSIYSLSALISSFLWTLTGSSLALLLSSGQSARIAKIIMGVLFIATAIGLLFI